MQPSPKNGYWSIGLSNGTEFKAYANPAVDRHLSEMIQKVGVFVDYEEGEVSFYNVDTRAKLYSFTGCNFTEKLFPIFSPGLNDGGRNSAQLIITSVTRNAFFLFWVFCLFSKRTRRRKKIEECLSHPSVPGLCQCVTCHSNSCRSPTESPWSQQDIHLIFMSWTL